MGPALQRALDVLVPGRLSEAVFWNHFFSHVDVIKATPPPPLAHRLPAQTPRAHPVPLGGSWQVRVVSDHLLAQELLAEARTRKHCEWMDAFDRRARCVWMALPSRR